MYIFGVSTARQNWCYQFGYQNPTDEDFDGHHHYYKQEYIITLALSMMLIYMYKTMKAIKV